MMPFKDRLALWLDQWAIPDWRQAWKKLSVQFNLLLVGSGMVWNALPLDAQTKVIESALTLIKMPTSWAVVVIGLLGLVFRLKSQTPKDPE